MDQNITFLTHYEIFHSRYNINENVILRDRNGIINNTVSVVKIFNEYCNQVASNIDYPIPENYAEVYVL